MEKLRLISVFAALTFAALVPTIGCGKPDDGMSKAQQQKADRLDEIAKQSDGDWNKVSQADRDYILNNITSGSEQQARMLLLGKAGKMGRHGVAPGGPPASSAGK